MPCYCDPVANITVTVPDSVYQGARIRAAELGTSVSALVGEYLRSLTEQEARFARLEEQQRRVLSEIGAFRGGDRLSRDDVHERALR